MAGVAFELLPEPPAQIKLSPAAGENEKPGQILEISDGQPCSFADSVNRTALFSRQVEKRRDLLRRKAESVELGQLLIGPYERP